MRNAIMSFVFLLSIVRAYGAAEGTSEWSGDILAFTLQCKSKGDFFKSPISGFLAIVVLDEPIREVRHLPVSEISEINQFSYGAYIEWKNERMKNGRGFITTVVYIPSEVMPSERVIEFIESCRSS